MAISNYPNGFSTGVTVRGVPLQVAHPGQVFFVNNSSAIASRGIGGSNSNLGTYQKPFATLDYAIGQCVANRGDIIFIMPGHSETVASASEISIDVAGVAIIGLGVGSLRPTFNLTNTASTISMSAANCSLKNVLITGGVDAIVSCLVVSAADCTLDGVELRDVTGQMLIGVLTTASASRLKILNHIHAGDAAAGSSAAIALVGGDRIEITADVIDGNFSVGGINVLTTATTNLYVHDVGRFFNRNSSDIFIVDTITASTGQIGPNINIRLADNAANITEAVTGATFVVQGPIKVVNLAGEQGVDINWVASTDA